MISKRTPSRCTDVTGEEYKALYEKFFSEYKKIDSTEIQLVKWHTLAPDGTGNLLHEVAAQKMVNALVESDQESIYN